ncbi:MAG: response regulator [Stellaceae bacterium]
MTDLNGIRVLVVEDELLIVMMLEDMLESAGCVIVGPCNSLAKALQTAAEEDFDVALLDVNLAGKQVFPLADVLIERNLPFIFMTGYGADLLPAQYAMHPTIAKPFKIASLMEKLSGIVSGLRNYG